MNCTEWLSQRADLYCNRTPSLTLGECLCWQQHDQVEREKRSSSWPSSMKNGEQWIKRGGDWDKVPVTGIIIDDSVRRQFPGLTDMQIMRHYNEQGVPVIHPGKQSTEHFPNLVFQEWMYNLPMQQQSVLILACRGPDNIAKFHPCKQLVARYRACVLKAAYLGRAMKIDEFDSTTFMSMRQFSDDDFWGTMVKLFFDVADELPHHYLMHLVHGAEIIGYKHPNKLISQRWYGFYIKAVDSLHMLPETEAMLDDRLSDWHQRHWDKEYQK